MTNPANDLRLQLAHFNNFIINNYLIGIEDRVSEEPLRYLFSAFEKLSDSLTVIGNLIAKEYNLFYNDVLPLIQTLEDASLAIYLIEQSENIENLTKRIHGINTYNLKFIVDNIKNYGLQFGKSQAEIQDEIVLLKTDNSEYFDDQGLFRYEPYFKEAVETITYLKNNSEVDEVKKAFCDIAEFWEGCKPQSFEKNYTTSALKTNILTVLSIILIGLSYIEPFFEQPGHISNDFEQIIGKIIRIRNILLTS